RRRARVAPADTALIHDDRSWTYGEVAERVARLATALRDRGVRAGDRVAYLGANHPGFVETLFATGELGSVFVPLNTRLAAAELAAIVRDAEVTTLVWAPELSDLVDTLLELTEVGTSVVVGD